MGKSDKEGFLSSTWTTIILVVILVVVAALLIWIFKTGGFDKFKPKPKPQPLKPVMQQFQLPTDQVKLQSIDNGLKVIADFSWKA
jgi:uncharacterized ion transporter superfamily protein YfcC